MKRHVVLVSAVAISVVGVLSQSPIAQDPTYHLMADRRSLFGVPNGWNVLSNMPFAIVGALGLSIVFSAGFETSSDGNACRKFSGEGRFGPSAPNTRSAGRKNVTPAAGHSRRGAPRHPTPDSAPASRFSRGRSTACSERFLRGRSESPWASEFPTGITSGGTVFRDRWLIWPYAAVFAGALLAAFGSAYYHLAPDNARLVWDRLPMTVGFMGLLTAILAERVSVRVARLVFIPLLAIGAGSVGYWYLTEVGGAGDLRLYVLVEFGALLIVVLLLLLYPAREPGTGYLVTGLVAYAAAKCFELEDAQVLALGQIVSGHTLKHLLAAGGVGCIVAMIRARAPSP